MRISVFGLGYVGVVTAACFSRDGHQVTGVDIVQSKVDLINRGQTPIIEEKIGELIDEGVRTGSLTATTDGSKAIQNSDIAIVCVGTPSNPRNGSIDTGHVRSAALEIGKALKARSEPFTFVLRSTVIPGTVRSIVIPALEEGSGRKVGDGYHVLYHPEFLREGSSVRDFDDPPKIVIGEAVSGSSKPLADLYKGMNAPLFITSIDVAESIKYADNAFHALKITFANEMGQFCQAYGVDSREVMKVFAADTKLNISSRYLRPGFAFGGSCLPKDLRALTYAARSKDVSLSMLENVLISNKVQVEKTVNTILELEVRNVGFVGLAFKPGTDDLRESPLVELAERLIGKGISLKIYDNRVQTARLIGSNKEYMERHLPHLGHLLVESLTDIDDSEAIVVGHPVAEQEIQQWIHGGKYVIDLVGTTAHFSQSNYQGIAW